MSDIDYATFDRKNFDDASTRFAEELGKRGMKNGYITLCEDSTVLIDGCALTPQKLRGIAISAEIAQLQYEQHVGE